MSRIFLCLIESSSQFRIGFSVEFLEKLVCFRLHIYIIKQVGLDLAGYPVEAQNCLGRRIIPGIYVRGEPENCLFITALTLQAFILHDAFRSGVGSILTTKIRSGFHSMICSGETSTQPPSNSLAAFLPPASFIRWC